MPADGRPFGRWAGADLSRAGEGREGRAEGVGRLGGEDMILSCRCASARQVSQGDAPAGLGGIRELFPRTLARDTRAIPEDPKTLVSRAKAPWPCHGLCMRTKGKSTPPSSSVVVSTQGRESRGRFWVRDLLGGVVP